MNIPILCKDTADKYICWVHYKADVEAEKMMAQHKFIFST